MIEYSPSQQLHLYELPFVSLILAILTRIRVFICIFLMTKDVGHFTKWFSAIRVSSSDLSSQFYIPFLNCGTLFLMFRIFCLKLFVYSRYYLYFSLSEDCRFVGMIASFAIKKLLSFMRLYLLSVSDCGVGVLFYQYPV